MKGHRRWNQPGTRIGSLLLALVISGAAMAANAPKETAKPFYSNEEQRAIEDYRQFIEELLKKLEGDKKAPAPKPSEGAPYG